MSRVTRRTTSASSNSVALHSLWKRACDQDCRRLQLFERHADCRTVAGSTFAHALLCLSAHIFRNFLGFQTLPLPTREITCSIREVGTSSLAMSTWARSTNRSRALVATVIFAAFFWTLLLSVSPQLHARIHADGNRADHNCAVTLVTTGSYEHSAQPPLFRAPVFNVQFSKVAALSTTWVRPLFLGAHIFAHAPPARG